MPAAIMPNERIVPIESRSDSSGPPSRPSSTESAQSASKKRNSVTASLDLDGKPKQVKRRAAKACAACRARKVRCDVTQQWHKAEDGSPKCSNCHMDGIKCVIEESKRRKKHLNGQPTAPVKPSEPAPVWNSGNGIVNPSDITNPAARRWSASSSASNEDFSAHVPHPIYQNVNSKFDQGEILRRQSYIQTQLGEDSAFNSLLTSASISGDRTKTRLDSPPLAPTQILKHQLPGFLKPLPQRMTSVDIDYLWAKGALTLPDVPIRNALLRSYMEYVHPYMPLIEARETLEIINDASGESGRISLLLYQAIMFAGTAFVDMDFMRRAGYSNRKAARKAFFQKARVLYDFDYEIDRVSLVQSLLLMTYWYETPDDQKDTWHWMGVAISLAHTIGLHRNPENSNMEPSRKKLWKRIWWSCFMRDRLVALGMRRPTRIKDEDYDVPMLTEEDFEIFALPENNATIPRECTLVRDVESQRQLALMCIAKAKLCLCVSHVLSAQYSVLVRHQGMQGAEGSTRSSVMLFPKKIDQTDEVKRCDVELQDWIAELPECCENSTQMAPGASGPPVFVQRSLLHMVYLTTLSALHRPQVLPSAGSGHQDQSREMQDFSRKKVRESSREITRISQELHARGLEKYLPTTGVTVLLPAIIIHLLDIKSCNDEHRQAAMDGFCHCMLVLEKLRDNYSSADYATQFLEAAIRKADLDILMSNARDRMKQDEIRATMNSDSFRALREKTRASATAMGRTPPSTDEEVNHPDRSHGFGLMDIDIPAARDAIGGDHQAVHTPPTSDSHIPSDEHLIDEGYHDTDGADFNVNEFLNFESNESWNVPLEEGAHGESGGFMGDMNWIDQIPGWSKLNTPAPDEELFAASEVRTAA